MLRLRLRLRLFFLAMDALADRMMLVARIVVAQPLDAGGHVRRLLFGAEFNAELVRGRQIEGGYPAGKEPFVEPREAARA